MYLSKLELHGFKSFAHKTTILFDPGVTAIVGPNGCGKSNVIDAVRWVLGEQRARLLRSEKMENVIFNGTSNRRALGMSEVSLTVENTRGVLPTAYSEVTITRRLFRSGESEYLLNGTTCRLKDILDLFMDTGMGAGAYSVIELKMIEDILSDSAADRRRLFEEAAGVTKYKLRRRQALGKLDATQADLARLTDLIEEIERNVRSLSRQAQKASRHQRLQERLTLLELALSAHDFEALADEHRTLDREARTLRIEVEGLTTRLDSGEATLEAQRTELVAREQALAEAQRALNAHIDTVRSLEAEQRVGAERRSSDARALERLDREAEADRLRRDELDREDTDLADRLGKAETDVEAAEAAEAEAAEARDRAAEAVAEKRAALDTARRAVSDAERAASDARAAIGRIHDRKTRREAELDRLDREFAALTERLDTASGAAQVAETALSAAVRAAEVAAQARDAARAEKEAQRQALDSAETAARDARLARDTAQAELGLLESLVAEGDGTPAGVSFLAMDDAWPVEITTVADLVSTTEQGAPALETALGEWAEALVVETEKEAQDGIARLRQAEAGHATFIVLERLPARPPAERSPTPPGSVPALSLAQVPDARYESLLRLLLQNVFVVDDLDTARRLADEYPVARFVTRTGEWTRGAGVLAGGRGKGAGPVPRLGRKERIDAVRTTLESAEAHLARAERVAEEARTALTVADTAASEQAADAARRAQEEAGAEAARLRAERAAFDALLPRLSEQRDTLNAEATNEETPAQLQSDADAASAAAQSAADRVAEAVAAHDDAEATRREAEATHTEARLALAQTRNAVDTLRRDAERIARTRTELDTRAETRAEEEARLRESLEGADDAEATLAQRLAEAREGSDGVQRTAEEAEGLLLQARALIADTEKTIRTIRNERDETVHRRNNLDLRLTEIITRQDAIAERLEDEHGVSFAAANEALSEAAGESGTFDAEAAREAVPGLRESIRSLGAVNALALETYDEEKERLDFLTGQRGDLQQAEQTLLDTITEINTTAAERFDETFTAVRSAFQRLFNDLFGGDAKADIRLDGDDPLEAPIEVYARPKGKKPSTINQLSGGEKTLTAIALLFAIYLVKPSPFCILDEVDAPLDDANIGRFMQLIRSFADSTQFILVTHNKLTMEAADRMYGITMPEPGISRLVGVRFDDVAEDEEDAVAVA